MHSAYRLVPALLLPLALVACGGGDSSSSSSGSGYSIGGKLTGLDSGGEITLAVNGADALTLTSDGTFTFATRVASGGSYAVTVSSQPSQQFCTVSNSSGTISGAVTDVQVACGSNTQLLYTFTGGSDGLYSDGSLIMDKAGNLYGTTVGGGTNCTNGCGIVFKLTPSGNGYTESVLYRFTGRPDGENPASGLVLDSAGNLYGTTQWGGSDGYGTVFKLTPTAGGYTESILYNFTGGSDGQEPHAGLIADGAGNLYGTTYYGGVVSTNCGGGCGTVFKLTPSAGSYTESVLYRFTDYPDGAYPQAGLVVDSAGNLYGTTSLGGANDAGCSSDGCGTVFKLAPRGGGYTETVLYRFTGYPDGTWPFAGLILDGAGNLYGTTLGTGCPGDCGTVFKLSASSGGYTKSTLYSFTGLSDGGLPYDGVILDSAGNLYGTTNSGGSDNDGTVFKLTPSGGDYTESTLHAFAGGSDGSLSYTGLIFDSAGNLYGTTKYGGSTGDGVIFEVRLH